MTARPVAGLAAGAVLLFSPSAGRWIGVAALLMCGAMFVGILLPAVWSSKASRRRDARAIAEVVLKALFGQRH